MFVASKNFCGHFAYRQVSLLAISIATSYGTRNLSPKTVKPPELDDIAPAEYAPPPSSPVQPPEVVEEKFFLDFILRSQREQ